MPRINTNPQLSVHDNYKIMNIINPYRFSGPENQFKFTIDTDLGDAQSQFTLPLREGYSYNMIVYWGDGTSSEVNSYDDPNITHNYAIGGEYQISIQGTCQAWYFNNGGDKDKLTSIDQWGDVGFTTMFNAFYGCINNDSVPDGTGVIAFQNVTDFARSFYDNNQLSSFDNYDLSSGTNFLAAWRYGGLTSFSGNDISSGEGFNFAWQNNQLSSFDNYDLSSGTGFRESWRGNPLISFSGNNLTAATDLFYTWASTSLSSFDCAQILGGAITRMSGAWLSIPISELTGIGSVDVTALTDAFNMFNGTLTTSNYDSLLIGWAAQNVQTGVTLGVGNSRYSPAAIDARDSLINDHNWIINDGGNEPFQFTIDTNSGDTISSFTLPLRNGFTYDMTVYWGDGESTDITAYDDSGITHNYATGGSYQITIIGTCQAWYFNNSGDKDKLITIDRWGDTFTYMHSAFYGCSNLTEVKDSGGIWCSNVSSFQSFIRDCTSLTTLDVSNWDTSNVSSFRLFAQSSALFVLDVSAWNTNNVNNFGFFADDCTSLTTLDVSNWDTSNVIDFTAFIRNSGVSILTGTENWNTSGVTSFALFAGNSNLTSLNVSGWTVTGVTDFSGFGSGLDIDTDDYDVLLNEFASQDVNTGLTLNMGTSQYSTAGETARNTLTTTYSWTITDGGCVDCP